MTSMAETDEIDDETDTVTASTASDEEAIDRTVEPGEPRLEHILFVLLGAIGTIAVFLEGFGLF